MGKLLETLTYRGSTALDDASMGSVSGVEFQVVKTVFILLSRLSNSAGIPLGIYNILSHKSIPLQIQPQILTFLSLVTWGQVYYYGHKWSLLKTILVVAVLGAFGAALELAGTLPFLLARSDNSAPHAYLLAMAILSAVGLGLGVLRHYWDIYTHRSVRGISFIFVGLDAAGDLTSLLSVGKSNRFTRLTLAEPPFSFSDRQAGGCRRVCYIRSRTSSMDWHNVVRCNLQSKRVD